MKIDRRSLLVAAFANLVSRSSSAAEFDPKIIYAGLTDGGIDIPPVHYAKLKPQFLRRRVPDTSGAPAGTILVSVKEHFLFVVNGDGTAIRYGIGVGRAGYLWRGRGIINRISSWPRWTPTEEMRARLPELRQYGTGFAGGIENPLGARALYIYQHGQDTLYRVHGSPEWWSVGRSMSSGCIRMLNQDVIDLSLRSKPGSSIIVY